MIKTLWLFSLLSVFILAKAGDSLYHPLENATNKITHPVNKAKFAKKHVLIQAGGKGCTWCFEFNRFTTHHKQIDSAINANYIVYHLNFSPQNKNDAIFRKYDFAFRFGFPVFIILDSNSKMIHTQNSTYLDEGKSYSKSKVLYMLDQWKSSAFDEKKYDWEKKN